MIEAPRSSPGEELMNDEKVDDVMMCFAHCSTIDNDIIMMDHKIQMQ